MFMLFILNIDMLIHQFKLQMIQSFVLVVLESTNKIVIGDLMMCW